MKNDEGAENSRICTGLFTDRQHSSPGFIVRTLSRFPGEGHHRLVNGSRQTKPAPAHWPLPSTSEPSHAQAFDFYLFDPCPRCRYCGRADGSPPGGDGVSRQWLLNSAGDRHEEDGSSRRLGLHAHRRVGRRTDGSFAAVDGMHDAELQLNTRGDRYEKDHRPCRTRAPAHRWYRCCSDGSSAASDGVSNRWLLISGWRFPWRRFSYSPL
jgi:hypothetical protein